MSNALDELKLPNIRRVVVCAEHQGGSAARDLEDALELAVYSPAETDDSFDIRVDCKEQDGLAFTITKPDDSPPAKFTIAYSDLQPEWAAYRGVDSSKIFDTKREFRGKRLGAKIAGVLSGFGLNWPVTSDFVHERALAVLMNAWKKPEPLRPDLPMLGFE